MSVIIGYGEDFIEIREVRDVQGIPTSTVIKTIDIPIGVFDNMVRDYLTYRREGYVQAKRIEGSLFDDDHFQI